MVDASLLRSGILYTHTQVCVLTLKITEIHTENHGFKTQNDGNFHTEP